ncbi:MAG: haloacid dehalogenase-like hydrolase [Candidatus Thiodiazotropha sp.]
MKKLIAILSGMLLLVSSMAALAADPLSSWNEGKTKAAIMKFVEAVTTQGSKSFIPARDRIAVFDNDGTLWSEKPAYFQLFFAMDRVKAEAPKHPEWKNEQPFKAVLEGDMEALAASGEEGLLKLVMATHGNTTTDEFAGIVEAWLATAKHPKTGKPYTDMVYQPMLELLAYLRQNGFKTYIVSGGGIEFMRPWAERVYGVPPEQVIGSSIKVEYQMTDSGPVLMRLPEINFIDDKAGKPVGIHQFIGKVPVFAAGNSDGDMQMLEWTSAGSGPRFGLIVHHTDAKREWAYDRKTHVGKLDKALDKAGSAGWVLVDMMRDWKTIYPD